jgi:hypothetical protein
MRPLCIAYTFVIKNYDSLRIRHQDQRGHNVLYWNCVPNNTGKHSTLPTLPCDLVGRVGSCHSLLMVYGFHRLTRLT